MTFPKTFDAYVPSNGLTLSSIKPDYVPFETLSAIPIDLNPVSFAYAKKLTPPLAFGHVIRCFYFALALLYTGFPSGTPGVPQIGFEELAMRLSYTTLLHDLGWSNTTEALKHPAHAMTFELHGAFMTYEHLHAAAPGLDAHQVGDIVQSIVLHTSGWPSGFSSANQILMAISAGFDVGGFNGTLTGLNNSLLWNPKTVQEIEKAYPRGDFYNTGIAVFNKEFTEKPNCLMGHFPGGLAALEKNVLVGPIVPVD
ncbi:hypothetical protein MVEN_01986500 [Mycena venus]|uniref:HD domain-containing protein n=1 Tax=Mycena venus TaxID=2733690 RepID=A0A8H7CIV0_9AGAR|nr:hypothetical protein MVEN_01986500 [Mycena venus]